MIERQTEVMPVDVPGFTTERILAFLFDAVMWKKPVSCLEIGTYMGRSSAAICNALNLLGGERSLTCVDSYPQNYSARYLDRPIMQHMINRCGPEIYAVYTDFDRLKTLEDCFHLTLERKPEMKRYCTLVKGDTQNLDFSRLPEVDFAYIDGDHEYAGVRNDLLKTLTRLQPEGLVIFDDYYDDFPGVIRLVDEARQTDMCSYVGREGQDIAFIIPDPKKLRKALLESSPK